MAAVCLVISATRTLLSNLQSAELKTICSIAGSESELQSLQETVINTKSLLIHTDAKDKLSDEEKRLIEKLKLAVYDADDFFNKFNTHIEKQKQLNDNEDGDVSKTVSLFFSRFGFNVRYTIIQKIKDIRDELNSIVNDAIRIIVDYQPIRMRREESRPYVYHQDVIGREKEIEEIINMLLTPPSDEVQGNVSFLAIVGIGGLGKTTLAQLVYDDDRVKNEFPLRLWACVADYDQEHLDERRILAKIMESATNRRVDGLSMKFLEKRFQDMLGGNKFLLVLDDLWTENYDDWSRLESYLTWGAKGSRVVVTTRSKKTARVVGCNSPYELQGLSIENSWILFERIAFGGQEEQTDHHELREIAEGDIVYKCSNVPLAIRVVGTFSC